MLAHFCVYFLVVLYLGFISLVEYLVVDMFLFLWILGFDFLFIMFLLFGVCFSFGFGV